MDEWTAFMNGELEEEIYMDQRQGFVEEGTQHLLCKLKNFLNGSSNSQGRGTKRVRRITPKKDFLRAIRITPLK